MTDAKARKVALIGTGGTISILAPHALDYVEYPTAGTILEVDALAARFPELGQAASVVPIRFRAMPSSAISERDWLHLARLIDTVAADPSVDGIVVTHGTATLEETAYFLTLCLKTAVPVVIVGSQRPPNTLSSDAGLNLVNAVRVAAAPQSRGRGVLVLLNDVIHAARDVTKTSNHRLEAFQSDPGILGHADEDGRVSYYHATIRRHAPDTVFDVRERTALPRVDIAYSYAFCDGAAIAAFAAAGARAIVCGALPPGLLTPAEFAALRAAQAKGVRIVISSRAGHGRMLLGQAMREAGMIAADNLSVQKARVLTMLALTVSDDPKVLQDMFDTY